MDNQDKIRYKKSVKDWFIKIFLDENEKEISRLEFANGKGAGTGLFKEMQAWKDAGNDIEPQFTPEELAQKEIDDLKNALESQKSICIELLRETDYKLLDDFDYPEDVLKIKANRKEWKRILKSDMIETVPGKLS